MNLLDNKLGLVIIAALYWCGSQHAVAAESAAPLALVNGKAITQLDYDLYLSLRTGGDAQPETLPREMVIQELINRELIAASAVTKGLDKDPGFLQTIDSIRLNLLAGYALQKEASSFSQPTEEELQQEYAQAVSPEPVLEYKAQHILRETEQQAQDLINELDKGADFDTLAKGSSDDHMAAHGTDLGWFRAEDMPPAFSAALATLTKGGYTKTPVPSDYGWHVIRLEDTRNAPPVEFESIKEQLATAVINKRVQAYVKSLRDQAKIEIK